MGAMRWVTVAILAGALAAQAENSGTDPVYKYAWAENAGWANAAPTNGGVTVHFYETSGYLTGLAWGENVGWIKLGDDTGGPYANDSATDWGVNMDASGNLNGYAWGENIGWIKFAHAYGGVTVNPANGEFAGHAWGENVGWLKFSGSSPDYGVRTLAFDMQAQGTPNWWLDHHNVAEAYDEGDGFPAWEEYVADTDPNDEASYLRIVAISNAPSATDVAFWPASTQRYYTLTRREDLQTGSWSDVAGQVSVPGSGGLQTMRDTNMAARMFYTVEVTLSP
jgi:hypothetical protein